MDLFKYYASAETILVIDVPCAPLVILARQHLQSLLCLGPCIYHDFGQYMLRISADAISSLVLENRRDPLARCYRAFVHVGSCDVIGRF